MIQSKMFTALIIFAFLGVYGGVVGVKAYNLGRDKVQQQWNMAVAKTTSEKIDTKVKQDEIQNAPIDDAVTMRRLRNAVF